MLGPNKLRNFIYLGVLLTSTAQAQIDQEPFFQFQEPEREQVQKSGPVSRPPPLSLVLNSNVPSFITIHKNTNGRYLTRGKINSFPVIFDIDTEIRKFVISESIAKNYIHNECKPKVVKTANGYVNGCESLIAEMYMGHFKLLNVPVLILKGLERDAIIGMDILGHFDIYTEHNKKTIALKNSIFAHQANQSQQRFVAQNNTQPLQRPQSPNIRQREYARQQQPEAYVQTDRRIVSRKDDIKSAAVTEFDNFLKKTLLTIYLDRYLILKIIMGLIVLRILIGLMVAYQQNKERKDRNYPH